MTFETTQKQLGYLTVLPESVTAGKPFGMDLIYTVGERRIEKGGCIRFQIPQACPDPQLRSPIQPGYCRISCSRPGVEFALSASRSGHPKDTAYVTIWGKNLYACLTKGSLHPGDKVILHYGASAAPEMGAFANAVPTPAPFFSGDHYCSVAIDPDGSRAAPFSGMLLCDRCGQLKVLPGSVSQKSSASCLRGHVRILSDHEDNPVQAEWTADSESHRCSAGEMILFGDMHCHSAFSDGLGTPDDCYRFARDVCGLDFCAVTDHAVQMSEAEWLQTMEANDRWNEEGRFLTLLGYELNHRGIGDKNIYYPGSTGELLRDRVWGTWDRWIPPEGHIQKWLDQHAMIMSHLHAGHLDGFYHPQLCRLLEIYSNWGNCEREGAHPAFIPALRQDFRNQWAVDALGLGWHIGFTANSDDHMARPGWSGWHRVEKTYRSGLTAVYVQEPTRAALFDALYQRHTYATTGPRMLIEARMDGKLPGSEIASGQSHSLSLIVHSLGSLQSIELIRMDRIEKVIHPDGADWQGSCILPHTTGPFYLRITRRDGHLAWTSPWYMNN